MPTTDSSDRNPSRLTAGADRLLRKATIQPLIRKIICFIALACIFSSSQATVRAQSDFSYTAAEFVYRFWEFTPAEPAYSQVFTLTARSRLCFQLATQYRADFGIIPEADLAAWQVGGRVRFYARFSGNFGTKYVTLGAGRYALVGRDKSGAASNSYSAIVRDFLPTVVSPYPRNWQFLNNSVGSQNLQTGQRGWWGPFNFADKYRYRISGVATGNAAGHAGYVIPEDQLERFKIGEAFTYYAYLPGLRTGENLNLPAGRYYVVYYNVQSGIAIWNAPISWTATIERWRY